MRRVAARLCGARLKNDTSNVLIMYLSHYNFGCFLPYNVMVWRGLPIRAEGDARRSRG